jgi:DNA-binding GntR family transcriptional regulator
VASEFAPAPLSRGLLSDQAYDLIRQSIIDGIFAPGEQLVESQLARKLSISQAPMREALKKLSHEGLVTNIPRCGSFVTEISAEAAAQAREVRCVLEELAARLAAVRLTETDAHRLRDIVEDMWKAARTRDIAAFRVHDTAFHRAVMELSGNAYLPRLWLQLEPSLQSLQVVSSPRFAGEWKAMAQAHADLVSVLEDDDAEAAARRFRDHVGGHALDGGGHNVASSVPAPTRPRKAAAKATPKARR